MESKIKTFIAERIVSWTLELAVLVVVGFIAISETRKTAEETRAVLHQTQAMLVRYDKAVSAFASGKAGQLDGAIESITPGVKNAEAKVKNFMDNLNLNKD